MRQTFLLHSDSNNCVLTRVLVCLFVCFVVKTLGEQTQVSDFALLLRRFHLQQGKFRIQLEVRPK